MPRIAVIGLSSLEIIGIKSLIEEIPGKEMNDIIFTSHKYSPNLLKEAEPTDLFIVNAEVFALHTDFFIPRKNRTAVLSSERRNLCDNDTCCPASGIKFLYRDSTEEDILDTLRSLMDVPSGNAEITGDLSVREKEVLKELASGKTNKEIADALSISINTVITHRKNISSKLGIKSVSGLSLYALMNGVI